MGNASKRRARRNKARSQLAQIFGNQEHLNVVHYSCESFHDNPGGGSRRVTSIAVLKVGSGQAWSFSIHQVAEKMQVNTSEIADRYDAIERAMLDGFHQYMNNRPNDHWLHWNMRDSNYGFPAIAHRYEVLGGNPVIVPESRLFDLAEALPEIFGDDYIEHGRHGRLEGLMRLNGFKPKDFLTGKEESDAFVSQEYVKLHQSTLRKVRLIHAIPERTWEGTLRTQAKWWPSHGASLWGIIDDVTDHPGYEFVLFLFAVVGFVTTVLRIIELLRP